MNQFSQFASAINANNSGFVQTELPLFIVVLEYEYGNRTHRRMFDMVNQHQLSQMRKTLAWCYHNKVTPTIFPAKITKAALAD